MSIDDELHEQLDRAFGAITPRPVPVEGAVRRGKALRARRRAAAAAGLAAAVAIGVIVTPAVRHWQAAPAPAAPTHHYTVTVQAPGPHSPAGLIASGTVNGKRWQLIASRPGTDGAARGQQNVMASGPALGEPSMSTDNALAPDGTSPVSFGGFSGGPAQVLYGAVQADVWYVKVRLGNGSVLTLRPATVYGARATGFAAPAGALIVDATAYSRHGEIATAIPFIGPDGFATFSTWLKPGQHGLPRASGRIGSGTIDGRAWSATAFLGPWGICVLTDEPGGSTSNCGSTASGLGTGAMFVAGARWRMAGATASPSVSLVIVRRPDGTTFRIRPVTVGIQKFFVFPMSRGHKPWTWTAYDGSGRVVASSEVTPDV